MKYGINFDYENEEKLFALHDGTYCSQHQPKDKIVNPSLSLVQSDNGGGSMKAIVERIARALVDRPDAVSVSEISGAHSLILELKVAKEDLGKIIGKQGRNAGALRTIIQAVSAKHRKHTVLEIIE